MDVKENENFENDPSIIVDFFFKEVRSVCELPRQVFHSGLTKQQTQDIENIQKKSLKIILGDVYSSYEEACTLLSAEPLSDRRQTQCVNFVKRAVKSGLHSDIFILASSSVNTRSSKDLVREYTCNTKRYYNSPLVYLSQMHNEKVKILFKSCSLLVTDGIWKLDLTLCIVLIQLGSLDVMHCFLPFDFNKPLVS